MYMHILAIFAIFLGKIKKHDYDNRSFISVWQNLWLQKDFVLFYKEVMIILLWANTGHEFTRLKMQKWHSN